LARADVVKLFEPFALVFNTVQKEFVEKPDPQTLLAAAMNSMKAMSPTTTKIAMAGRRIQLSNGQSGTAFALDSVYDVALGILNERASDDDKALLLTVALNGMLSNIDVHASYMDAKGFRDMQTSSSGQFGGLGIELTMENGILKVVSPLDGTPASRGGVLANDLITHLDDVPLQGMTLNQAVSKMRGVPGEKIKLRILRKGNESPMELTLAREQIMIVSVRARVEANDLAYLRVTTFNEQTTTRLKAEIAGLTTSIGANKLKGFVLDLRNNPGGLLEEAVSVADAFIERGEIVSTRGRVAEETQRRTAQPGDLTKGKPLIVLINGGTASAAEIVAGALQDHKRATLVGTHSFAKGGVQTIIPLGTDKGALRLTTARYFTPSGKSIQARGIDPDIEVLQDGPGGPASPYVPPDPKDDKALATAIGLLKGQK
jgi:carboxyl-terminal processing protease